MTATRVFNPLLIGEFCKIGAASPAASAMSRNLPCSRQVNRIKRDLFGSTNPVETNRIFNEEIDKHQDRAIKKWGFDFRAGHPLGANSQYIWERVGTQESTHVPEMYTLTRAAHVRPTECNASDADLLMDERAERENYSGDLSTSTDNEDSCYDSQDESASALVVFKVPARHTNALSPTSRLTQQLRKRQPKITEYMKERKRLAQTPKKLSPAKRMRTSSGSSSGASVSSSSSSVAASISSHFIAFKRQRNQ